MPAFRCIRFPPVGGAIRLHHTAALCYGKMQEVPVLTTPCDALLLFPPLALETTFVELGVPRLVATLKKAGFHARQDDLNVRFMRQYWLTAPDVAWLAESLRKDATPPPDIPALIGDGAADIYDRFLRASPQENINNLRGKGDLDLFQVLMRTFAHRRHLQCPSWYVADVRAAVEQGHAYYEEFFGKTVFDQWPEGLPPLVGMSLASAPQTFPAMILSRMIKQRFPDTHVAWGGPWATAAGPVADALLRGVPWVDSVMVYEGERSIVPLVRAIADKRDFAAVPNLRYRDENNDIVHTEIVTPLPFEHLPLPDFEGMPMELYLDRIFPVQTTRNCYWGRCIFCYHRVSSATVGFEERSAGGVVDAMERLKEQYGINTFFLADSCTHINLMRSIALEILRRELDISWIVMGRSGKGWDKETCNLLALSGLREVYMGLETTSPRRLKQIEKGISLQQLDQNLRLMTAAGIRALVFVLDYPGQTAEELKGTFEWVLERQQYIAAFIAQKFSLGRNSVVFEEPGRIGIVVDPGADEDLDVFGHRYTAVEEISPEQFNAMHRMYAARFKAAKLHTLGDMP